MQRVRFSPVQVHPVILTEGTVNLLGMSRLGVGLGSRGILKGP